MIAAAGTIGMPMKADLLDRHSQHSESRDQKQTFRRTDFKKDSLYNMGHFNENDQAFPGILGHAYTVTVKLDTSTDLGSSLFLLRSHVGPRLDP